MVWPGFEERPRGVEPHAASWLPSWGRRQSLLAVCDWLAAGGTLIRRTWRLAIGEQGGGWVGGSAHWVGTLGTGGKQQTDILSLRRLKSGGNKADSGPSPLPHSHLPAGLVSTATSGERAWHPLGAQ
jgi:hypothetical protein